MHFAILPLKRQNGFVIVTECTVTKIILYALTIQKYITYINTIFTEYIYIYFLHDTKRNGNAKGRFIVCDDKNKKKNCENFI